MMFTLMNLAKVFITNFEKRTGGRVLWFKNNR